jgi:hypothetical protein
MAAVPTVRSSRWGRVGRIAGIVAGALAGLVLIAVAVVAIFGWNMLRGPAEGMASAALGRPVTITGDLHVGLGWTRATVRAEQVRLGNAPWSADPDMAQLGAGEVTFNLWALVTGDDLLPAVVLTEPKLLLERKDGTANWEGLGLGGEGAGGPTITKLEIHGGTVTFRDPGDKTTMELALESVPLPGHPGVTGLKLSGGGRYQGHKARIDVTAGSLLALTEAAQFPVDGTIALGATRATFTGTLNDPLDFAGLDLELEMQGNDAADLFPLAGIPAPNTPPYRMKGRLTFEKGAWVYKDFAGKVGDSDLAGTMTYSTQNGRPHIAADLRSKSLDFDDLGMAVGAPPGTGKGETASPEQQQFAKEYAARGKVLPDAQIDFAKVRSVDADIHLRGTKIVVPGLPLRDVNVVLVLRDGVMTFDPLDVTADRGTLRARIVLDASKDKVVTDYDIRLTRFDIAQALPGATGEVSGRFRLKGTGNSVADSLATANGDVSLFMREGKLSSLLVEVMGLDLAEALGFALAGDETTAIRCAVLDFGVKNGLMSTRLFLIDTEDSLITGTGQVNLAKERLDLEIRAEAKDFSPLAAPSAIGITGTFKSPDILPDLGELALRGGVGVVLGALIGPFAALAAFLEIGEGEDANCTALLAGKGK